MKVTMSVEMEVEVPELWGTFMAEQYLTGLMKMSTLKLTTIQVKEQ